MFNFFNKSNSSADQLSAEYEKIGVESEIKSHLITLQSELNERQQRALALLLETATTNKYSGSAMLGGWILKFSNGVVNIERYNSLYDN